MGQKALATKPDNPSPTPRNCKMEGKTSDSSKVFADFHAHRTVTMNGKRNLSDRSIEGRADWQSLCWKVPFEGNVDG